MTDAVRTPDELLDGLPGFPFKSRYREFEGIRLAHLDEGSGSPVVFLHGEPTWSFLWRDVLVPVRDAGYRCIAPDLPGFGRSDKPIDIEWYTYDRHVASVGALLDELALSDVTLAVHDWGGPIGLRIAVQRPEQITRLVILDSGIFTGHQRMADMWLRFREFVRRSEELPVGFLVRGGCKHDPGDEVIAAYEAPFPNEASKAGARAFPKILPTSPEMPGAREGEETLRALRSDSRPKLLMWADSDPVLPLETGRRFAAAIGSELDHVIPDAGHFLQEDAGEHIGGLIADWLRAGP
ncbi:MAG: haloalkane dehalogenase [Actinomycetota bacterium]|nr:haloalkane dehalogenase [Actinomycetota bacterium]